MRTKIKLTTLYVPKLCARITIKTKQCNTIKLIENHRKKEITKRSILQFGRKYLWSYVYANMLSIFYGLYHESKYFDHNFLNLTNCTLPPGYPNDIAIRYVI